MESPDIAMDEQKPTTEFSEMKGRLIRQNRELASISFSLGLRIQNCSVKPASWLELSVQNEIVHGIRDIDAEILIALVLAEGFLAEHLQYLFTSYHGNGDEHSMAQNLPSLHVYTTLSMNNAPPSQHHLQQSRSGFNAEHQKTQSKGAEPAITQAALPHLRAAANVFQAAIDMERPTVQPKLESHPVKINPEPTPAALKPQPALMAPAPIMTPKPTAMLIPAASPGDIAHKERSSGYMLNLVEAAMEMDAVKE
ncbi:hypothetical protein AC578_7043 [Pseudocercospora eumusae]|uniref:Uncharacterized protein n=1 Tax=Pseudocercospora eumusae TaxID=321146 RepID=A0A139GVX0_9PEZI|nr:hypothetical protein AC578_7043 [Pseudocercospora eumusae]